MEKREEYKVERSAEPEKEDCEAERSRLLVVAYHALRSFQYGNHSVELARTAANEIEKELIRINYEGFEGERHDK